MYREKKKYDNIIDFTSKLKAKNEHTNNNYCYDQMRD